MPSELTMKLECFKAYDLRGRVPDQLNDEIAFRIGQAFAAVEKPATVVIGYDIRLSSPGLASALGEGLMQAGIDVLDIGLCGTEQVYFATSHLQAGGGIMVTASHNPSNYNGMKLVRGGSRPISGDSGLDEIRRLAESASSTTAERRGVHKPVDCMAAYVAHLLSYVDVARLKPLKIVVNPGNGGAGIVLDKLAPHLPFELVPVHYEPDGHFPHGVPNPLLPENRDATAAAIRASGAQLGVAWDGDFDRCFLFDEDGQFIEGYYVVGLLARAFLAREPGARIIHDPRLTWNTIDEVSAHGGIPVQSKTGHAFIKERMRLENALYGGEMSAHHYFRDFNFCDSGMIPWLLVASIICESGQPLSALVADRMARYPVSGEINRKVQDPAKVLAAVKAHYQAGALAVDETDGLSLEFADWRFNLRMSNTEPVIRLNVETRQSEPLMQARTEELLAMIGGS